VEDLVEVRDYLLSLGETEKVLDILIQTSGGVEHSIFSGTYQWHLAGVEVCIKQERVDEDFLPLRRRVRAGVAHPAAVVQALLLSRLLRLLTSLTHRIVTLGSRFIFVASSESASDVDSQA